MLKIFEVCAPTALLVYKGNRLPVPVPVSKLPLPLPPSLPDELHPHEKPEGGYLILYRPVAVLLDSFIGFLLSITRGDPRDS